MTLDLKTTAAGLALGLGLATTAPAATLDFVAEAAGNERGVADGTVITFDGLPVTFSAAHTDGAFAYFDDLSGGDPGGLGVCSAGLDSDDQCTDPGDDNVTSGESVTLSFGSMVDFAVTSFNDVGHNSLDTNDTNTLLIGTNGAAGTSLTFADALNTDFFGINSITFAHGGDTPEQFYVGGATATPVPLPAAGLLMLGAFGGIGGLAAMRRRRKAGLSRAAPREKQKGGRGSSCRPFLAMRAVRRGWGRSPCRHRRGPSPRPPTW